MNMSNESTIKRLASDDEVESRARRLFRNACENADSYHVLRLGLARRKALQARAAYPSARLWAPLAGGAVACCALVIGVMLMRPIARVVPDAGVAAPTPTALGSPESAEDTPVIASNQMDMVQDLDFYRWLAAQPVNATSAPRDIR